MDWTVNRLLVETWKTRNYIWAIRNCEIRTHLRKQTQKEKQKYKQNAKSLFDVKLLYISVHLPVLLVHPYRLLPKKHTMLFSGGSFNTPVT
jgi:hypothetical protein